MHPVPLDIGAARYVAALTGYLQIVMPMQNAIMDTDVTIDEVAGWCFKNGSAMRWAYAPEIGSKFGGRAPT